MKCRLISSEELSNRITLIKAFMCDRSDNEKKFSELLKIFKESSQKMTPSEDESRDFRILDFIEILKQKKWIGPLFFVDDTSGKILDGIHRGIAYLICIEDGVSAKDLPRLIICTE